MTRDGSDERNNAEEERGWNPGRPARAKPAGRGAPWIRFDTAARQLIGRSLRALYADIVDQPLPERFATLPGALSAHPQNREPFP